MTQPGAAASDEPVDGADNGAAPGEPGKPAAAPAAQEWIPQDLRGHKSLAKFKSPEEVAKAYVNLESAYGKRFEEYLKPDAPEEVRSRVRAAMGVPGAAEEYDNPSVPEGVTVDDGIVKSFKGKAHELGVPKAQAKALMDWYVAQELDRATRLQAEAAQEKERSMKALREKWGAAADRNIGMAQRVVAEYGGADLKAALDETGAGNHPAVLAFLARLGQTLAEDNLIDAKVVTTSVEDAKKEIAAIKSAAMKDRNHPWVNKKHPEHAAVLARMSALHEIAYGEV